MCGFLSDSERVGKLSREKRCWFSSLFPPETQGEYVIIHS